MKEPLPESKIEQRLRAEAKDSVPPPSPFLHSRIMGTLARDDRDDETATAPSVFRRLWPQLTAFALVMVALALVVSREEQTTPPTNAVVHDQQLDLTTTRVVELVEATDGSKLHDLGATLSSPLENELKLALNDAKTAVDFLAKSFLPTGFEARLPSADAIDQQ